MKWWQFILFPFAVLYNAVTSWRNYLYDRKIFASVQFDVDVVTVGNLSVGGTGKTPMIVYLTDFFLKKNKNIAILSRGYARKTKGFIICGESDSPETVGDESYFYYEFFKDKKVTVSVCEERAVAIPLILQENSLINLILLDDAFQHRTLRPSFSILLTTRRHPFWQDFLLPMGRLREARKNVHRSDLVVVTKSTDVEVFEYLKIRNIPYFQTKINYRLPQSIFDLKSNVFVQCVVVCGLANNQSFIDYVDKSYDIVKIFSFNDHHCYTKKDCHKISKSLEKNTTLVTTQKDAVKLKNFSILSSYNCVCIPIEIEFLEREELFQKMLIHSLKYRG